MRKRRGGRAGGWRRKGRKARHVNQGDLSGGEKRAGVRASIVAKKGRNGPGAKGTQEGGDVTDGTRQPPDAVPPGARPAGEIRARWAWVEAEVWTERMLTALETGVLGGKWFSLMDKVYALPNLRKAFERIKANGGAAGVDHLRWTNAFFAEQGLFSLVTAHVSACQSFRR